MPLPLSGIRVIEIAHVMAGPVCGLLLADMGADVVKVERLPNGDGTRGFIPPDVAGESAAFMMLNRGKRGIALDLRAEQGRTTVRRLVSHADVIIENFRLGTMEKMGLGFDELSALNQRLVYCQITGFGRTGPLARQGGFDLIAQGYSGLMSFTGEGPDRAPVKVGAPVTDITAGILAAFGVVSALFERERTGKGQRVDTSLFEAGITQTFWQSAIALASGLSPGPMGSAHPLAAPYQTFPTADGWINVGASNEATWQRLTQALDILELQDDLRFRTNTDRMGHLDDLVRVLAPNFLARSTESWLGRLDRAGVPAGPVASIGEMLEHPQTQARDMVIEVEHTRAGTVRSLGSPVKMSGSEYAGGSAERRGAPLLGEHTREVLEEFGFSGPEISELMDSGVVL
ncbi:MAG: CaiB/BaiF CoA-transferase family protein [Gemmatimonadetes bacterium]|jgi:crotonobetainyl-CoA:carnitine CoA-transferase CaiB-like acyl-CoA transferase|nr:CaiB/BaiF CoA-transferase family protein [Gemmatimonadota bacterium]